MPPSRAVAELTQAISRQAAVIIAGARQCISTSFGWWAQTRSELALFDVRKVDRHDQRVTIGASVGLANESALRLGILGLRHLGVSVHVMGAWLAAADPNIVVMASVDTCEEARTAIQTSAAVGKK